MSNVIDLFTGKPLEDVSAYDTKLPTRVEPKPKKETGLYLGRKLTMRFYPKLQRFKANNVYFDLETTGAFSYDWWQFVALIDDKVVFNKHRYSVSTAKHQSKVRRLLSELGIEIDLYVDTRKSLNNSDWLVDAIGGVEISIADIKAAIANPRSRKKTNLERVNQLKELNKYLNELKAFGSKRGGKWKR